MCYNLNISYISFCIDYMQNKSNTSKTVGFLHPFLVLDNHFDSINIDFIRPLPMDKGYNILMIIKSQLGFTNIYLILC